MLKKKLNKIFYFIDVTKRFKQYLIFEKHIYILLTTTVYRLYSVTNFKSLQSGHLKRNK